MVTKGRTITIMDVAIVTGYRMEDSWRLKLAKYGLLKFKLKPTECIFEYSCPAPKLDLTEDELMGSSSNEPTLRH